MKSNTYFVVLLVLVLSVCYTPHRVSGQDIIVKKNGEEISARVEQVSDKEITYRKFENLSGPLYILSKSEIFMIKYENGSKDVFADQPVPIRRGPAETPTPVITEKDIKPANAGAVMNYILLVPILTLGTMSTLSYDGIIFDEEFGIISESAAIALTGIGVPIGAMLPGITRKKTGVSGIPGLRVAGWINYGVSMAGAISLAAGAAWADFYDEGGVIASTIGITLTGTLATLFFAIDAGNTASEAKEKQNKLSLVPVFGIDRDVSGKKYSTMGIRLYF
ncbi:MAG: hypothetical protein JW973_08850 [Bacteroidales bacterium]|nr:hypothetical protein [Bacteroidales bacterium]